MNSSLQSDIEKKIAKREYMREKRKKEKEAYTRKLKLTKDSNLKKNV